MAADRELNDDEATDVISRAFGNLLLPTGPLLPSRHPTPEQIECHDVIDRAVTVYGWPAVRRSVTLIAARDGQEVDLA